ncbi:hypothetical protein JKP88DRAFT_282713 [Tribonema minus]|uniref:Uncharacterized protein n=1 Tax=Tribonema minus TaxID=303371 RepID=A0A836C7X3_9STRA|nr:hypothetical protein JKP88DRAFT_282713 [Tribonema minus]
MNAAKTACCPASCGTCGGADCATKPGGPDSCCDNKVVRALDICETKKAPPCIPTTAPRCGTTGVYGYMNSKGDACCPLSCGSCEASTCANEIGGPASCCRGTSSGSLATVDFGTGAYNSPPCNTYFKAPCRITSTKTVPPKPADWPNKLCTVDSDCKEYNRQPVKCSSVNGKKICTCVNTANQFVQVTVPGDFKSLTAGVGSDFNGRCIAKGTYCYNQGQGSCVNDGSSPAAQATCDSDKNTCVCPAGNYLIHVEHGNTYSLGSVYCFHSSKKFSAPHNIDDDIYIYYFMGYCK